MEIDKRTLLKFKTNTAMTLFYLQQYDKALTCCQHILDNYGDSKVLTDFFPVVTLKTALFIMQNKLDEARDSMESNMQLWADNVITVKQTKHAAFLLNMSLIYFLKGNCEESLSLAKRLKTLLWLIWEFSITFMVFCYCKFHWHWSKHSPDLKQLNIVKRQMKCLKAYNLETIQTF